MADQKSSVQESVPTEERMTNYGATSTAETSTTTPINNHASTSSTRPPLNPPSTGNNTSRIEPKVWLANERTWLNWCRTGVLLGSFGVVLLNSSSALGARIMGFVYSLIAVGTIGYGQYLYKKRIRLIEKRHPGHFDDLIAPIIIALSLFTAILVNFILRVIDQERHKSPQQAPKAPWIAAPASSKFASTI